MPLMELLVQSLKEIQASFSEALVGVGGARVHKYTLYKEVGRYTFMAQWLVLAARWWNTVAVQLLVLAARWWTNTVAEKGQGALALGALNGKSCWSRQFLNAMDKEK